MRGVKTRNIWRIMHERNVALGLLKPTVAAMPKATAVAAPKADPSASCKHRKGDTCGHVKLDLRFCPGCMMRYW